MGSSAPSSTTSSDSRGRRLLVAAAVFGLTGTAAVAGYRGGLGGSATRTADLLGRVAEERAAVEEELVVIKTQLRSLERRQQAAATATALRQRADPAAPGEALDLPAAPVMAVAGPPPANDEDRRDYFARVEARLGGEERDGRWADPIEERLRRAADGLAPRLTVEAVRCGRATCRLDLRRGPGPDAPGTLEELVRRAVRVLPQALVAGTAEDEPGRVVVYLARDAEEGGGFPPLVGRAPAAR